jgi:hypothetical protein
MILDSAAARYSHGPGPSRIPVSSALGGVRGEELDDFTRPSPYNRRKQQQQISPHFTLSDLAQN